MGQILTPPTQPGNRPRQVVLSIPPRQMACLAAVIVSIIVLLALPAEAPPMAKAAIVVSLSIGLWTTGWLPQWLTALIFFTLSMMGNVAGAGEVFAGFSSSATWLVLAGAVIGLAIDHTGLGDRLASRLAPAIGRSFARAVATVIAFGLVMTFAMPSAMGRVMLILPIVSALAGHLGYPTGSRGRRGIILAGVFGTYLPAFAILPANIPNVVFVGAVEAALGAPPHYGHYFLLHFPILGLLKAALLVPLLIRLYRDTPQNAPNTAMTTGKISPPERHLAVLLVVAVGFWATDAWHGIPAAWIGMLVAVWCLFPGSGLTGKKPFSALQFEPIIYVAGIVSMGAIANQSGLGTKVATWALSFLPLAPDAPVRSFGILSGLSALIGLVVTLPGVPPVMTSLLQPLADASHLPPLTVAMIQVVGFSTVILPYQAPPLIVAIQSGGLEARDVTRLCLITAAITIVALWPLDALWWQWLGQLG